MLRGEKEERVRALQTSFFPTQPSSPDVYGLYKLLRARECPPLRSEQQQCRSPDLSLSLSPLLSLSWLPHCKSIQTHKRWRQLGNRTIAILQRLSITATWPATSDRFHTLVKNRSPPPDSFCSISHSVSVSVSLAHSLLPLSSDNYCSIYLSRIYFCFYVSFSPK